MRVESLLVVFLMTLNSHGFFIKHKFEYDKWKLINMSDVLIPGMEALEHRKIPNLRGIYLSESLDIRPKSLHQIAKDYCNKLQSKHRAKVKSFEVKNNLCYLEIRTPKGHLTKQLFAFMRFLGSDKYTKLVSLTFLTKTKEQENAVDSLMQRMKQ